jgi:hypothetical protein
MKLDAKTYLDTLNQQLGGEYLSDMTVGDDTVKSLQDAFGATGFSTKQQVEDLASLRGRSVASVIADSVMKPMEVDLEVEFAKHGFPLRHTPTIGVLPTLDFNACAMTAPNGDEICLMDILLYSTLIQMARAATECMFEGVQQVEGNYKAAFRSLLGHLMWFSRRFPRRQLEQVLGLVMEGRHLSADPMRVYASGQLGTQVIVFIMAHEFAHHALGHVGVPGPLRLRTGTGDVDVLIYNRSQLDEFAADELGFRVFLSCSATVVEGARRYFTQGDIAPLLFFHFLDIYERVIPRLVDASPACATHPPASARLQRLTQLFAELAHEDSRIAYPYARDFFTDFLDFASRAVVME